MMSADIGVAGPFFPVDAISAGFSIFGLFDFENIKYVGHGKHYTTPD